MPKKYCGICHQPCLSKEPADENWFRQNRERIPWRLPPPKPQNPQSEKGAASANFKRTK